jgi:hypothetical protein
MQGKKWIVGEEEELMLVLGREWRGRWNMVGCCPVERVRFGRVVG